MKRLMNDLRLRWFEEEGQTMVEYSLILGLVALVAFSLYQRISQPIQTMVNSARALF